MIWPTIPGFTPGDADLDLASLILADGSPRGSTRRSSTTASSARPCRRSRTRPRSPAGSGSSRPRVRACLAGGDRESRRRGDRPARKDRPDGGRARAARRRSRSSSSSRRSRGSAASAASPTGSTSTTPTSAIPESSSGTWRATGPSTPASVRVAVGAMFSIRRTGSLVRFHPETSSQQDGGRRRRDRQGARDRPGPSVQSPDVQTSKLPNGMELFVVERNELPKVALTLVTRAGRTGGSGRQGGSRPHDR